MSETNRKRTNIISNIGGDYRSRNLSPKQALLNSSPNHYESGYPDSGIPAQYDATGKLICEAIDAETFAKEILNHGPNSLDVFVHELMHILNCMSVDSFQNDANSLDSKGR